MTGPAPTPAPAVEAATRIALASLAFADGPPWWTDVFTDWMAVLDPLEELDGFDVVADLGLGRLRWRAAGEVAAVADRALAWFEHLDVEEGPRDLVVVAGALGADLAGTWVQVEDDALRSGWDVEGSFAVAPVLDALGDDDALEPFGGWAAEVGLTEILQVGALGGAGEVELLVALPGDEPDAQVANGLALYDAYDLAAPPDDAVGDLLVLGRPRFAARVAFADGGVAELGLLSRDAADQLVLQASDDLDVADDQGLAAFEAALGAVPRRWFEVGMRALPTARVHYRLA